MSNIDTNTVSNNGVKTKRQYVTGLSPEEKKERLREQKRLWFQKYRSNEENKRIRNAYNAQKQREYYAQKNALKTQNAITTF